MTTIEEKWNSFVSKLDRPAHKVMAWKEENLEIELKRLGIKGMEMEDILDYWRSNRGVRVACTKFFNVFSNSS